MAGAAVLLRQVGLGGGGARDRHTGDRDNSNEQRFHGSFLPESHRAGGVQTLRQPAALAAKSLTHQGLSG
jgi:hypothetical protein